MSTSIFSTNPVPGSSSNGAVATGGDAGGFTPSTPAATPIPTPTPTAAVPVPMTTPTPTAAAVAGWRADGRVAVVVLVVTRMGVVPGAGAGARGGNRGEKSE